MPEWLHDLLLPETDEGVAIQWILAAAFWAVTVRLSWRADRNLGLLTAGLALCTLAWFLLRAAH